MREALDVPTWEVSHAEHLAPSPALPGPKRYSTAERACGRSAHHATRNSVKPDDATAASMTIGFTMRSSGQAWWRTCRKWPRAPSTSPRWSISCPPGRRNRKKGRPVRRNSQSRQLAWASSHGCTLQSRDVQLDHVLHRGEDAARDGRVGVGEKTGQSLGHNLPRDAPPVAKPAAHDFRPAVGGEGCPQPIYLR